MYTYYKNTCFKKTELFIGQNIYCAYINNKFISSHSWSHIIKVSSIYYPNTSNNSNERGLDLELEIICMCAREHNAQTFKLRIDFCLKCKSEWALYKVDWSLGFERVLIIVSAPDIQVTGANCMSFFR